MLIYVIQCGDFYKVGLSANIRHRIKVMELGNPHPLHLVSYKYVPKSRSRFIEMTVHTRLADYAMGREWFRASLELIQGVVAETIETDKATHAWNSTRDTYGYKGIIEEILAHG